MREFHGIAQAFEAHCPEAPERHGLIERLAYSRASGRRYDDLAAVCALADACGGVDSEAGIPRLSERGASAVNTHSDAYVDSMRP